MTYPIIRQVNLMSALSGDIIKNVAIDSFQISAIQLALSKKIKGAIPNDIILVQSENNSNIHDDESLADLKYQSVDGIITIQYVRSSCDSDFLERVNKDLDIDHLLDKYINNKDILIKALRIRGSIIMKLPESLQTQKHLVMAAVSENGSILKYLPLFKNDYEVVSTALMIGKCDADETPLFFASLELQNDRQLVKAAIIQNYHAIILAYNFINEDDNSLLLAALKWTGYYNHVEYDILQYIMNHIPTYLLSNIKFMTQVIIEYPHVINHISTDIKYNREFNMNIFALNGLALIYVDDFFKNDRDMVINAVSSYGFALSCVNEKFRNDKDIVIAAVTSSSDAYEFASYSLKRDVDVILALKHFGLIPYEMWLNPDIIKHINKIGGFNELYYGPWDNEDFIKMIITLPNAKDILHKAYRARLFNVHVAF